MVNFANRRFKLLSDICLKIKKYVLEEMIRDYGMTIRDYEMMIRDYGMRCLAAPADLDCSHHSLLVD